MSSASLSHLHLQVIFIFKLSLPSDMDHHSIWIITGHHHWIWIITPSGSTLLDHHHWISIITGSGSSLDLDHPGCYLVILLVTGISTEPAIFYVGCRPSLHVGLLQFLYLTLSQNGQHSHLTMRGTHPTPCHEGMEVTFTSIIGHNYYHL